MTKQFQLISLGKTVDGSDYYKLETDFGKVIFAVGEDSMCVHAIWSNKPKGMKETLNYIVNKFNKNKIIFWEPSIELLSKLKNITGFWEDERFGLLVEIEWKNGT